MAEIAVLDQKTINQIAAGEVVERPSSVVKELIENAIDAGASAVTVEIREGGIRFIRITDNGCGIEKNEVPFAFLRHSTSKIRSVEDLMTTSSLGFRGEALSSIAAVAQVELVTKTRTSFIGSRYIIEGGEEKGCYEIGCPEGTTFLVRNLFYNTPARRKFLKSPVTEAGYISDLVERLAVSHPEISFKFINNNKTILHTSGNRNLKDIIYHVYGREITSQLLPIDDETTETSIHGWIGKPVTSRGNRNYENYFINGRYIRSSLISKAIEEAYKPYTMQHKYPFTVLHLTVDSSKVDVNVHPTKMELRFSEGETIYRAVFNAIRTALSSRTLIPDTALSKEKKEKPNISRNIPEPFENKRKLVEEGALGLKQQKPIRPETGQEALPIPAGSSIYEEFPAYLPAEETGSTKEGLQQYAQTARERALEQMVQSNLFNDNTKIESTSFSSAEPIVRETTVSAETSPVTLAVTESEQQTLFQENLKETEKETFLKKESVKRHKIIGQLFSTYWLVEFEQQLFIIDQHAAHEKILYERTINRLKEKEFLSQLLSPPIILSLSLREEEVVLSQKEILGQLGFTIEPFGGREYAVSSIPADMFGLEGKELLLEFLDDLAEEAPKGTPDIILERIASLSCKAAVKGNKRLSVEEAKTLIDELMTLENPFHCPHGRPTIISMTKYEIEKKFKRIV